MWCRSIRLWTRPSSDSRQSQAAQGAGADDLQLLDEEQDEEHFVSSYEKANPLEVPKALLEVRSGDKLRRTDGGRCIFCWCLLCGAHMAAG